MPYLTPNAYLARFGEREAATITNTIALAAGQTATPDQLKIREAIDDAGELIDSYIGVRYKLPLDTTPPVVEGWTAALAREALYVNTGRTPEAVTAAADRVRSQLRDASKGIIALPVEEGENAPASVAGDPAYSGDRIEPTFAGTGALDGYMSAFQPGYSVPAWRRGG